jgi:hypothetical protein
MKSPDGRECSEFFQHHKIALAGRRTSTLYLLNPRGRRIEKVQVDDCAITEGPRCDWLVLLNDMISHEEIYVELKGSDIHHAVEQLTTTIEKLSENSRRLGKRCFVVFTRNPLATTEVQRLKVNFMNYFRARFLPVKDKAQVLL